MIPNIFIGSEQGYEGLKMQQLLTLADEIPWIMAPAVVIAAMVAISVLVAAIRLLEPASKVMLVAIMLALSGGAMVMSGF
jgi:hypothetical protein